MQENKYIKNYPIFLRRLDHVVRPRDSVRNFDPLLPVDERDA